MRPMTKAMALCLAVLLLSFCGVSCRNRDFNPATLPADADGGSPLPADFQCWVKTSDGTEYALTPDQAAEVFDEIKQVYKKSDSTASFPDRQGILRLVFCVGGTAPEATIPAYQLPNATLYGVYTLFPDDTGRYGDDLITAHVHSFKLKSGSYERIAGMVEGEN